MICPPCVEAGGFNKSANDTGVRRPSVKAYKQALAKASHDKCEDKLKCPCQHFVGQAIQKEYR